MLHKLIFLYQFASIFNYTGINSPVYLLTHYIFHFIHNFIHSLYSLRFIVPSCTMTIRLFYSIYVICIYVCIDFSLHPIYSRLVTQESNILHITLKNSNALHYMITP